MAVVVVKVMARVREELDSAMETLFWADDEDVSPEPSSRRTDAISQ